MYRRTNILYRVVDALFRNRNLVLITMLCVAVPVALLLIFKAKGYTATAAIRIASEGDGMKTLAGGGLNTDQLGWKSASEVHVANLTTLLVDAKEGGFVDDVFKRAALTNPISLAPGVDDKRAGAFLKSISMKNEQDKLFSISMTWDNPEECKKLVQAVQEQYIDEQVKAKQRASESSALFLKGQIDQQEQRVNAATMAREIFRKKHPEIGPTSHEQALDYIQMLQERLRRDRAIVAEGGEGALLPRTESKYIESEGDPAPTFNLGDTPAQKHLMELQDKRNLLTSGAGAMRKDSDEVRALDRQIDQARLDLARERRQKPVGGGTKRRVLNPLYAEMMSESNRSKLTTRSAKAEIAEITKQIAALQLQLKELPKLQNEMERLDIRVNSEQDSLGVLRKSYSAALSTSNLEKEKASQTLKPVGQVVAVSLSGTKKSIIMGVVSLLLGAVVAGLVVALREWSDPTIRYETDIEQVLDIPVLTGLPDTRAVLAPKSVNSRSKKSRALLPSMDN
jgi:uncharacterized protein involved in exopolysaccharide biosynthesis